MRRTQSSLFVLALSLGCLAMCAANAAANHSRRPKPLKLLPRRSCTGLPLQSEFPGTVSESTRAGGLFGPAEKAASNAANFVTTCQFNPPEPTEQ